MIFLSVGTQLPFDRLISAVDRYLADHPEIQVFGQIAGGSYEPQYMQWTRFLSPPEFEQHFGEASAVIAHAGMGTIIQCLLHAKPILIMPRRASLGEQRNDHQLATAEYFGVRPGVLVSQDESSIVDQIDQLLIHPAEEVIDQYASQELLQFVRGFIG